MAPSWEGRSHIQVTLNSGDLGVIARVQGSSLTASRSLRESKVALRRRVVLQPNQAPIYSARSPARGIARPQQK